MIKDLLINKNSIKRAQIKSKEICKLNHLGKFKSKEYNLDFEIISINEIEGGIEVYARAWKDKVPIGFGSDGSVEIERFRIFNPPILVDDPNGNIEILIKNSTTKEVTIRKLKEDPIRAIQEVISHNITLVGKIDSNPIKNKIGKTTDIFYPTVNASQDQSGYSWYETITASSGTTNLSSDLEMGYNGDGTDGDYTSCYRGGFIFDTSNLPNDGDISSVTFSLYVRYRNVVMNNYFKIVNFSPASNNTIVDSDFGNYGNSSYSDEIALGYNYSNPLDFTYTTTGKNSISKTGYSTCGIKIDVDYNGSGDFSAYNGLWTFYNVNYSGTSNDPKLVITYTVPGSTSSSISSSISSSVSPSTSISSSASSSPSSSVSSSISSSISSSSSSSISSSISSSVSSSISYSVSSSISSSFSSSISSSISPSSSISSSISESISSSSSSSISSSISSSESSSVSSSISSSVSSSISASISSSISSSPSMGYKEYTRGDYISLPTDDANLETAYSGQDYTDVETVNGVFVAQGAMDQYTIHQYKDFASGSNSCIIEWRGQTNNLPSINPVYLQIYNRDTLLWDTIDSDNSTAVDTNFTLTADVADLTNYKDGNTVISCRIYQLDT